MLLLQETNPAKAVFGGVGVRINNALWLPIGSGSSADASRTDFIVQVINNRFNGNHGVVAMEHVEVDIIGAESDETSHRDRF